VLAAVRRLRPRPGVRRGDRGRDLLPALARSRPARRSSPTSRAGCPPRPPPGRPEDPPGGHLRARRQRGGREERADHVRRQQVGGQTARSRSWSRSGAGPIRLRPDGPLPEVDPDRQNVSITRGRVRHERDTNGAGPEVRELAESKRLSIRELIIETTPIESFIATPARSPSRSTLRTGRRTATASSWSRTSPGRSTTSSPRSSRSCRTGAAPHRVRRPTLRDKPLPGHPDRRPGA